jgi:hypothetical protein
MARPKLDDDATKNLEPELAPALAFFRQVAATRYLEQAEQLLASA